MRSQELTWAEQPSTTFLGKGRGTAVIAVLTGPRALRSFSPSTKTMTRMWMVSRNPLARTSSMVLSIRSSPSMISSNRMNDWE